MNTIQSIVRRSWLLGLVIPLAFQLPTVCRGQDVPVRAPGFLATFSQGSLTDLTGTDGTRYVVPPSEPCGATLHRGQDTPRGETVSTAVVLAAGQSPKTRAEPILDPTRTGFETYVGLDSATGELMLQQRARTEEEGLWGVGWWIADIPLDFAILVPGTSGVRLTRDTPGSTHQYDYPLTWEAQFVIVEGPQSGFIVWAEDALGRFKRLIVERRSTGWRLGFITLNDAPFDRLKTCESVTWRLNTYAGDWRMPAGRYRQWFTETCHPVPVSSQQPAWVKDTRACVIMGLNREFLEQLPARFDPPQTLLYLYDWRAAGYDRNYPDYTEIRPELMPFIERAHALRFRVMLHVNYFGVDPLHPLYKQFEPYHVRSPWGEHAKEWWVWPPEEPDIRFAYINPACQAWRTYFTQAMVELCEQTSADALHLDQTLCIFNDHNGRIDGMTMLEGNLALHAELRAALPDVALSGEGLNEVTCRYEAFAQRHVWGLDHSKGTYDRRWLAAAHPISSYILRPHTIIYGYLGYAPIDEEQLYAAWNEAYRKWGVIPSLKPTPSFFSAPNGFAQQLCEEVRFWQTRRVDVDLDGPWPSEIAFPWRAADGQAVVATQDRRVVAGTTEISRTITGTTRVDGTGMIPGWQAWNDRGLFGLVPDRWYPYFDRPRQADSLHIRQLPNDTVLDFLAVAPRVALIGLAEAQPILADLTALLDQATCGTCPTQGPPAERVGPGEFPDGATFTASNDRLTAHPPWKTPGSGRAYASFSCVLPDESPARFVSDVFLDPGAAGKQNSDGVLFQVQACVAGDLRAETQLLQDTAQPTPLELDLSPLRGLTVDLVLSVSPGPQNNPSFDWARWSQPRIVHSGASRGDVQIESETPWQIAASLGSPAPLTTHATTITTQCDVPGTLVLLRDRPPVITIPYDLARKPDQLFFQLDSGSVVPAAQYAGTAPGSNQVGGVTRKGLVAHPPNTGRTVALYLLTLPAQPVHLRSFVGLRDGSRSEGVEVSIEVNGKSCTRQPIVPGDWHELDVDLSPWAGQPVALGLVTGSAGPFNYDWTAWGEPKLVGAE
jgi:hypothetical protein